MEDKCGQCGGLCGRLRPMSAVSAPFRRLELQVVPLERRFQFEVRVFIDGTDLVELIGGGSGFDPDSLFRDDGAALLPTDPARRVAVYRCGCGDSGCGSLAGLVAEHDGVITWSDVRDFVGVFNGPLANVDEKQVEKARVRFAGSIAFDAPQYRSEVVRAAADRSWEPPSRTVARLVRQRLVSGREQIEARGYQLDWVAPFAEPSAGPEVTAADAPITVSLLVPEPFKQTLVRLETDTSYVDEPDAAARLLADQILSRSPEQWPLDPRSSP